MRPEPAKPGHWQWNDSDATVLQEIRSRLPARAFDFHAHLYRQADLGEHQNVVCATGPAEAGLDTWRERVGRQLPTAQLTGGLFFPMPLPRVDLAAANQFLIEQLARSPDSQGLLLVKATTKPKELAELFARPQVTGFKVYHAYGSPPPTFQLSPTAFVPEWLWESADERGWFIMLHVVRDTALADEVNQRYLREHCRRYPNAKLVLAHAGRGFHGAHTVTAVAALRDLDNLYFDTSAICEAAPLAAILREFGPRRLLWGSDFPVSEQRGRAITIGTGFAWIEPDQPTLCGEPVLVGLESLRALLEAADQTGLNNNDLDDIFYGNAMRLLGLTQECYSGE